jgi:exosortase
MPTSEKLEIPIPREMEIANRQRQFSARTVVFALLFAMSGLALSEPLRRLFDLCMSSEDYSYILLIPLVILFLFYWERRKIFEEYRWSPGTGIALLVAGLATAITAAVLADPLGSQNWMALQVTALVTLWIGAFVLCFGTQSARSGLFALLFSFLLVPLPPALIGEPINLVRRGSAAVSQFLFFLAGVPVMRHGMVFSMTQLIFYVARECSGIHSTIALFIASILMGHFWLNKTWKKVVLVLVVTPIVAFTNGLRIFVIAMLSNYVNMAFFHGNLHHKGGTLFFILALAILALITRTLGGNMQLRREAKVPETAAGLVHAAK